MTRIRVHSFFTSMDGYSAGPDQSVDAPMGEGGSLLHGWVFDTAYGRAMIGQDGGSQGVDDAWLRRGDVGVGATVMGRNMFGPVRGEWPDYSWTGWWGEEPPYGHHVFVLTHYARPSLAMGATTFHFATDGLESALGQATAAAAGADVRIGGGVATVRAALDKHLVDELHIAITPAALGSGELLVAGHGRWPAGMTCVEREVGESVVHLRFERA